MAVSNRVRAALTTTVLTTAATGFMAGCGVGGEEEDEQVAYCTDEDGEIVDEDYCDDGYNGRRGLLLPLPRWLPLRACRSARVLPAGGTRIRPDRHRGAAAGRPARRGKVSAGHRGSRGGIGSGVGNRAGDRRRRS